MQLRMTILILWGFPEKSNFRGRRGGGGGGARTVCRFKRGLGKEGGGVFEGVFIPPMHTMVYVCF